MAGATSHHDAACLTSSPFIAPASVLAPCWHCCVGVSGNVATLDCDSPPPPKLPCSMYCCICLHETKQHSCRHRCAIVHAVQVDRAQHARQDTLALWHTRHLSSGLHSPSQCPVSCTAVSPRLYCPRGPVSPSGITYSGSVFELSSGRQEADRCKAWCCRPGYLCMCRCVYTCVCMCARAKLKATATPYISEPPQGWVCMASMQFWLRATAFGSAGKEHYSADTQHLYRETASVLTGAKQASERRVSGKAVHRACQ